MYTCEKCDKSFVNKTDFTRHQNRKIDCSGKTIDEKLKELENRMSAAAKKQVNSSDEEYEEPKKKKSTKKKVTKKKSKQVKKETPIPDESDSDNNSSDGDGVSLKKKVKHVKKEIPVPDESDSDDNSSNGDDTLSKKKKKPKTIKKKKPTKSSPKKKKASEKDDKLRFKDDGHDIVTKEALREKIHDIHNYLRNNGIGYGMTALKVFNVLYGLKRIEQYDLFDKIGLSRNCKFSTLLELSNTITKHEELHKLLIHDYLDSISTCVVKECMFFEIPKFIKGYSIAYLVRQVELLINAEQRLNVQLSGKIYEYFIGRDKSAIQELGAYFTDRHIVDFIYKTINPRLVDGKVQSMIDPFGGSGGFTTGYINYLSSHNPSVDWSNNIQEIYHMDMNDDVIKYAGMECMCLTKSIPDMHENFRCDNTFKYDFERKFKYVITNPPYGGDKTKKSATHIRLEKEKDYIVSELERLNIDEDDDEDNEDNIYSNKLNEQLDMINSQILDLKHRSDEVKTSVDTSGKTIKLYAEKNELSGNDKESASLILMMAILDKDGTAVGVLKEGLFFDKKYSKIREHLLKHFNVHNIISVPNDEFENTKTKTSIIIFSNTGKTQEVEFSELIVTRYAKDTFIIDSNGYIALEEIKDAISTVTKKVISVAQFKQLKKKDYQLDGKQYNIKKLKTIEGYKMKSLSKLCKFLPNSDRKVAYGKEEGLYPFFTSSDIVKRCDKADYEGNHIIIGRSGNTNIHLSSKFSCSVGNFIISCKDHCIRYIFTILKANIFMLHNGFKGSIIPNISKSYIEKIKIPVPKDNAILKQWNDRITQCLSSIDDNNLELLFLKAHIIGEVKRLSDSKCKTYKLVEISEFIKTGKTCTQDAEKTNGYPYYGSGGICGYTSTYLYDDDLILIARKGSVGNCFMSHGKVYPGDNIFVVKVPKIHLYIIFYQLLLNKDEFIDKSRGSVVKGVTKEYISTIEIKIPEESAMITFNNLLSQKRERKNMLDIKQQEYNGILEEMRGLILK